MQVVYQVKPDLAEKITNCVRYIGDIASKSGNPGDAIYRQMPKRFQQYWTGYTRQLSRRDFTSMGVNYGNAKLDILYYQMGGPDGIQIRVWGERFKYLIGVDAQGKPDSIWDIRGTETGIASNLNMQEVYDLLFELTPGRFSS